MGNSVVDRDTSAGVSDGIIRKYRTSAAWVEGRAEQRFGAITGWPGRHKIAVFPDRHPGKYAPVHQAARVSGVTQRGFSTEKSFEG
ncbi:MAG: hypothetical protein AB3N11_12655 [Arenibacterium sp.]